VAKDMNWKSDVQCLLLATTKSKEEEDGGGGEEEEERAIKPTIAR
jgi:hypothetical protein